MSTKYDLTIYYQDIQQNNFKYLIVDNLSKKLKWFKKIGIYEGCINQFIDEQHYSSSMVNIEKLEEVFPKIKFLINVKYNLTLSNIKKYNPELLI